MKDSFGRTIDYLRVSITDRCNLRCVYCMPEEGAEMLDMKELLTFEEIVKVCSCMADMGLKKIKITGGEPLVRRNVVGLTAQLKAIPGIERVTLTTNGVLLAEQMEALALAGIDGVNISLDTLDKEAFHKITRRDKFDQVMQAIQLSEKYKDINFKINCVPMGKPDQNLLEIAELAKKYPIHVRFIEMMPIGVGNDYEFIGENDILEMLKEHYKGIKPYHQSLGNGPCHYYEIPGFLGKIGFISAMSHKFCSGCNRVRLTSEGFLKTCLQYDKGTDLKALLRENCSMEQLEQRIHRAILEKPGEHHFESVLPQHSEHKIMSQIGG